MQLQPNTPDAAAVKSSDRVYKQQQATYYNRRHRTRDRGGWRFNDPERAASLKFYFYLFSTMLCDVFYIASHGSERSIDRCFIPCSYAPLACAGHRQTARFAQHHSLRQLFLTIRPTVDFRAPQPAFMRCDIDATERGASHRVGL
jgi:hypothetical protein